MRPISERGWFWIGVMAALCALGAIVATLIMPSWIEGAFGVDPDAGSGSFEWLVVAALTAVAAGAAGTAAAMARRARAAYGNAHSTPSVARTLTTT
ncbi:MAG: hypothetical protein JO337_09250 [Acidimicrobiales bacterium]|nr:hypothetical protein [Acidimicrobiales bacterium]